MTFLNATIDNLEETIIYHQEQITEAQEQLDRVKLSQAYGSEAVAKVEEAIENIDPDHQELLKEHLLSLFEDEDIEYKESWKNDDYKSIEELQQEDPDNIVVFHSEQHLKDRGIEPEVKESAVFNPVQPNVPHVDNNEKQKHLIQLADNVVFDEDTDCLHIGFKISSDGYAWQNELCVKQGLSTKHWFEEPEYLENYGKELIIEGVSLDKARELVDRSNFSKPTIQEPVELSEEFDPGPNPFIPIKLADYFEGMGLVNMVEISPEVIYVPVDKIAYVAMRAKGRARNYGDYLTGILTVGEKYTVSNSPSMFKNSKYELRIEGIQDINDAVHLAALNLLRDIDHPDNREVRETWQSTKIRELPPAYTPSPKPTPLNQLKVGEIVSLGSNGKQYKVLGIQELQGILHVEVICTYNSEMPALVNHKSYLKEVYRVLKDDVQYSSDFKEPEEIELEFPSAPYKQIPLEEVELADLVTTSENSRGYYECTQNLGTHLLARCIAHDSLPHRVGQEDFYIKVAFLVEKANTQSIDVAA